MHAERSQGSTPTSPPAPKTGSPRASAPTGPKPGRAPESSVLPPSLTANALRDELRASARRRQDELAAIERERANLQKLAGEITAARAALQAETAKLDEKVKKAESSPTAASAPTPARPGGKPPPEALAKTLKVMKTEQAAALVARLDRHLAVDLLRQMRPADAGGVLEKMKPETAAELLSAMASGQAGGSR